MAYVKQSPEALLSDWTEHEVAARAMGHGWHVLHTSEIGQGATMVEGPDGKVIMPDLQLFDLIKRRQSRLVEVKAKQGAYTFQKTRINCTGIDRPKWEAYLRMNNAGVPVDLALIHMHWPVRTSPEIAPKLLWQTVETLARSNPMPNTHPSFPRGGVVWDVADFELLGDLPNPPQHIIEALQSIKRNLRVWETPPRLRRPRAVPGQLDLWP